jgi:hypothetical protein
MDFSIITKGVETAVTFIAQIDYSALLIFMLLALIAFILWKMSNSSSSKFDFVDLLIDSDTKKASTSKIALLFSLIISSWAFIHLTLKNLLTEWYFFGYMSIWVLNKGFNKWVDVKKETSTEK